MVTLFKENINLWQTLIFYSMLVFKTAFISEQNAGNRFGALLEISDKLNTKIKVFGYMILKFKIKTVRKI